jgi:hypothetical protein
LGGTAKAEAVKLPGTGIILKPCPMERNETGKMEQENLASESMKRSHAGGQKAVMF